MRSALRYGLWAALSLASCGRDVTRRGSGDECLFNGDCADPLVCAARRCRAPCRDDRDCANGWLCRPSVRATCAKPPCAPPLRRVCLDPAAPPICFSDGDCEAEQLCAPDNACRYRCAIGFDLDCAARFGAGARCVAMGEAAVCAVDAGAPDAPPDAALDAPSDTAPDAALDASVDRADADATARDADAVDAPTMALGCATVRRAGACTPGEAGCDLAALAHGGGTVIARMSDGELRGWGGNAQMQLGAVGSSCAVPGLLQRGPWRDVAVGREHACALDASGGVRCWGWNVSGQCGTGSQTLTVIDAPTAVVRTGGAALTDAVAVAAGDTHTCAIVGADRRVACWGQGGPALGGVGVASRPLAEDVPGLTGVMGLALQAGISCAWLADGSSWCWGDSARRADGASATAMVTGPQRTMFPPVQSVVTNASVTCALLRDGAVQCAGYGTYGARGDGTVGAAAVTTPRPVAGLTDADQLVAGAFGACARRRGGEVVCWGGWAGAFHSAGNIDPHAAPVAAPLAANPRQIYMGGSGAGWAGGRFGICAWYGGADLRCLGLYPGEGSNSADLPVRVNWTGAGVS